MLREITDVFVRISKVKENVVPVIVIQSSRPDDMSLIMDFDNYSEEIKELPKYWKIIVMKLIERIDYITNTSIKKYPSLFSNQNSVCVKSWITMVDVGNKKKPISIYVGNDLRYEDGDSTGAYEIDVECEFSKYI